MSIADKITSIEEHLQADYESLENIGADLTNVDKNIENIAAVVDNIYSNLPKVSGEGTSITLSPTLKGKLLTTLKGDTQQDGTPTPDTPIDIEVVTGTQELKVENKNLLNEDNLISGYISTSNGQIQTNTNWKQSDYIKVEPNTIYTISNSISLGGNGYFELSKYDNNKEWLSSTQVGTTGNKSYAYTTESTTYYIRLGVYKMGSDYGTSMATDNVQLEKGSTATDFVEHQEQTQTISLGDIELCKIGNYQDYLYKTSGKQLFDKTNYEQGYDYQNGNKAANTNWGIYYLPCEASQTFTISGLKAYQGTQIVQLDSSKGIVSVLANRGTSTTTINVTSTQAGFIGISFVWSTTASLGSELDTIMINLGSTALPYEPYGTDKWYKKEYMGKVVLNGSENWIKSNSRFHTAIPSANGNYVVGALCREYIEVSTHDIHANTNYSFIVCNSGWGIDHCRISFNNSDYASVDSWKNALATNNIIVYYQLTNELGGANDIQITNETLIEQLNNLEKAKSYNGVTNISCSGNLSAILSVSALKGE